VYRFVYRLRDYRLITKEDGVETHETISVTEAMCLMAYLRACGWSETVDGDRTVFVS
jgi:hypothetical protein